MKRLNEMKLTELTESESHLIQGGGLWSWIKGAATWLWDLFTPEGPHDFDENRYGG